MKPAAKYGIAAAIVIAFLVAAGGFLFLRDDSPDEVDLDAAVGSVEESTATTPDASEPAAADGVTGTWSVDAETGEFDFESATGTFAGIRIDEELASIGTTQAVGRTGDVAGTVVIDGTSVTAADIEVDLTTITTNDTRRNSKVQEALKTDQFPTATFSLTEPIELGAGATAGEPVSVTATGDLTIHGVTNPVQIPLEAQLVNDTVVLVGSAEIAFSDFDVEVPSAPIVLSVSDDGTLELQLLLTRS